MITVGFFTCNVWYEFGYGETLYSWFSTICYRLEEGEWGSKYPVTMDILYYDEENGIPYSMIDVFEKEIDEIKKAFSKLKPSDAIWSCEEHIYTVPLGKPNINYEAVTLREFYINNRGKNIFDFLHQVIESVRFWKKEDDCNAKLTIRAEDNI